MAYMPDASCMQTGFGGVRLEELVSGDQEASYAAKVLVSSGEGPEIPGSSTSSAYAASPVQAEKRK